MIEPFIVIRNFISPDRAMSLGKEYMKYCSDVNEEGDEFVPLSHSTYGYITFFELLFEKLPEVQELMGETLFPTYTYSRVYKKNAILEGHKDRPECEVSLTVHLSSDREWDIWIKDGDLKNNVNLQSGDALLYYGVDYEHGRTTKYEGEYYTQLFLHYIKSRGRFSDPYNAYLEKYKQKT
tara:strand:- start:127 stop:666 length:540 start_codon:yes stop_codon:yes gene_type:complete